jgi:hypothetical protein
MGNYIRMAGFSVPQTNVPPNTAKFDGGTIETADRNFMGAA